MCILTFHGNFRVSILVYDGVGFGYSVWMIARRMVSIVPVFCVGYCNTVSSVVLLVAWMVLLCASSTAAWN